MPIDHVVVQQPAVLGSCDTFCQFVEAVAITCSPRLKAVNDNCGRAKVGDTRLSKQFLDKRKLRFDLNRNVT